MHSEAPKVLMRFAVQALHVVLARPSLKRPASHGVHVAAPSSFWLVPRAHLPQPHEPSTLARPAAHVRQRHAPAPA